MVMAVKQCLHFGGHTEKGWYRECHLSWWINKKTCTKDEEGVWKRKKKRDTEWSKASQKQIRIMRIF